MKVQVHVHATLPQELLEPFMRHIRDFDTQHLHEVEFSILVEAPEMTLDETKQLLERYFSNRFAHGIVLR